jgi:ABC-type dipeptide/oligopeptide/nickel transport system ATPase component
VAKADEEEELVVELVVVAEAGKVVEESPVAEAVEEEESPAAEAGKVVEPEAEAGSGDGKL